MHDGYNSITQVQHIHYHCLYTAYLPHSNMGFLCSLHCTPFQILSFTFSKVTLYSFLSLFCCSLRPPCHLHLSVWPFLLVFLSDNINTIVLVDVVACGLLFSSPRIPLGHVVAPALACNGWSSWFYSASLLLDCFPFFCLYLPLHLFLWTKPQSFNCRCLNADFVGTICLSLGHMDGR